MSKRGPKTEFGHKKPYTLADHIELYGSFSDENGNLKRGLHRGHPAWVAWYCLKDANAFNEDGFAVYVTTEEERAVWSVLANVQSVVLKTDDCRETQRGFRTSVIEPKGIPDPDYEAFWNEWHSYRLAEEAKTEKPKRKRRNKFDDEKPLEQAVETQVKSDDEQVF